MSEPLRIGIAGLGTVGIGVIKLLTQNQKLIQDRAGRSIEITAISARDKTKDRGIDLSTYNWIDNPKDIATQKDIDVVVELIGGESGTALDLAHTALKNGKPLVTANKALLAHHGASLAQLADDNNTTVAYEAAVAGGIPAIKTVKDGLAGNNIKSVYGILNGTCNYILTEMRSSGAEFADVLKQAQELGYAEADPSFDVGGTDTAHKICVLAALCFGTKPQFQSIPVTGIEQIGAVDIAFAEEFGFRIKLLGGAHINDNGLAHISVEPCLINKNRPIAAVNDVYNAVLIESDFAGKTLITGRGAGEMPTASAVVADIIDIAKGFNTPAFGVPAQKLKQADIQNPDEIYARYYMRVMVKDAPGTIADISAALRDHNISIRGLIQRAHENDNNHNHVPIVMTTHIAKSGDIKACLDTISNLPTTQGTPCLMRIAEDI